MSKFISKGLTAALLLLFLNGYAAAPERIRTFNGSGISLKLPADVRQLPENTIMPLLRKRDRARVYPAADFWRSEQQIAVLATSSYKLTLVELCYAVPGKDQFGTDGELRSSFSPLAPPFDERKIVPFIQFYTGGRLSAENAQKVTTPANRVFTWRLPQGKMAVSVAVPRSGNRRPVAGIFLFSNAADPEKAAKLFETLNFTERSVKVPPMRKRRDAYLVMAADRFGWRFYESPHYYFLSDTKSRGQLTTVQNSLELARNAFYRYLPPVSRAAKLENGAVRVFADRRDYLEYAGPGYEWSGGMWNPVRNELLVPAPPEKLTVRDRRKFLREVIFHEGFHQYLDQLTGNRDPGMWFNEGSAQFFEDIDPVKGMLKPDDRTLNQLAGAARMLPPLEQFCALDHKGFYEERSRQQNYLCAHAMLFYLHQGAASERSAFAGFPGRYLREIAAGKTPVAALKSALQGRIPEELRREIVAYWSNPKRVRRSLRYLPAGAR